MLNSLYSTMGRKYFCFCFGSTWQYSEITPSYQFRNHSWQIWGAGDRTPIGCMQDKSLTHYAINMALGKAFLMMFLILFFNTYNLSPGVFN